MAVTKRRLTIENVNLDDDREMDALVDQMFTAGLARVKAEGDDLRRSGILDSQGNPLVKELPASRRTARIIVTAVIGKAKTLAG
jgi:hypothetical protein